MSLFLFYTILIIISVINFGALEEFNHDESKGELVFVQLLYRHGDRTPINPYPTDPWNDIKLWWPTTEWGELTKRGKEQHYELGKWLRTRYQNFINITYFKDDVYVQSTDVDRTLMSAMSNLAGLYPPTAAETWNTNIHWQPIPVHTMPEYEDYILATKKSCPAYDYNMQKLKESSEYRELDERFASLYKYLANHTGRSVTTLEDVQRLYDILFIESSNNKELPEWTKAVYPGGDMEWISKRSFATPTYTRTLARLKAGPLLNDILERFFRKYKGKLIPDRRMWIYSAHDITIANLLNTLKIFEYHCPPYAALIMLEMRIYNEKPFISVFYKNTTGEPLNMYIPGCGKFCPLELFRNLYIDVIPKNWETECKISVLQMTFEEANLKQSSVIISAICITGLMLISIYLGILYFQRKSYLDNKWYVQIGDQESSW